MGLQISFNLAHVDVNKCSAPSYPHRTPSSLFNSLARAGYGDTSFLPPPPSPYSTSAAVWSYPCISASQRDAPWHRFCRILPIPKGAPFCRVVNMWEVSCQDYATVQESAKTPRKNVIILRMRARCGRETLPRPVPSQGRGLPGPALRVGPCRRKSSALR